MGMPEWPAAGQRYARHAQRQQAEAGNEYLACGNLTRWNRAFGTMLGVKGVIEGIIEKHPTDIEGRKCQQEQRQSRIRQGSAGEHDPHEHVGPHRRQVGDAAEPQCQAQVQAHSSLRTHKSSRATASSTVPLRNGSGSTPHV